MVVDLIVSAAVVVVSFCCAVRRRCSYSFNCSIREIPSADNTIATATVSASALNPTTQLLHAVPVLGIPASKLVFTI